MDVVRGQVRQRSLALVFVLKPTWPLGGRRRTRMLSSARLNACLFVGRNNEVVLCQRLTVPDAMVEIQHERPFAQKVGIAWKDPRPVGPGAESVFVEPLPQRGHADRLDHAL